MKEEEDDSIFEASEDGKYLTMKELRQSIKTANMAVKYELTSLHYPLTDSATLYTFHIFMNICLNVYFILLSLFLPFSFIQQILFLYFLFPAFYLPSVLCMFCLRN